MYFYPAVCFVEMQSLLLCLLSCQVGEEVAHQGLFGFETAQIVLCTLGHQVQTYQWVTKCLLQGLQKLCRLLIHTLPLTLVSQVTGNCQYTLITNQLEVLSPEQYA